MQTSHPGRVPSGTFRPPPRTPSAARVHGALTAGSDLVAWVRALRPLAQLNVAPPIVAGAALLGGGAQALDAAGLGVSLGFGLLAHAFIVLANDLADADADAIAGHRTLVSGGSGVLVEGRLSRRQIARAAAVSAVGLLAYGAGWSAVAQTPGPVLCAAATLLLVWSYSFPPLRRAYVDGGAVLQALGVGVVLPLVGAFGQGGPAWDRASAFVPLVLLGWAGNVATALPDREGDARAEKRTLPVRVGETVARRRVVQVGVIAALCSPLVLPAAANHVHATIEIVAALAYLLAWRLPPVPFAVATSTIGIALQLTWAALA